MVSRLNPTSQVKLLIPDNDLVIHLRHCVPPDFAFGHMVESPAHAGGGVLHLADVVKAYVPLIVRTSKGMRKAAHGVVALEHQHAFSAVH
jgi:hypothetical protein